MYTNNKKITLKDTEDVLQYRLRMRLSNAFILHWELYNNIDHVQYVRMAEIGNASLFENLKHSSFFSVTMISNVSPLQG